MLRSTRTPGTLSWGATDGERARRAGRGVGVVVTRPHCGNAHAATATDAGTFQVCPYCRNTFAPQARHPLPGHFEVRFSARRLAVLDGMCCCCACPGATGVYEVSHSR